MHPFLSINSISLPNFLQSPAFSKKLWDTGKKEKKKEEKVKATHCEEIKQAAEIEIDQLLNPSKSPFKITIIIMLKDLVGR